MTVNIKAIEQEFFCKDLPVPYNTHRYEVGFREKVKDYKVILSKFEQQLDIHTDSHIVDLSIKTAEAFKNEIKNHTIQFYLHPPLMSDYNTFFSCIDCLLLNVNNDIDVNDVEQMLSLMNMTYLEYMLWVNEQHEDKRVFSKFKVLFELITKVEIKTIDTVFEKGKPLLFINEEWYLDSEDIADLKKIICFQNIANYKDEYISKAIEDELKTMRDIKGNKYEEVSLEKRVSALSCLTHERESDIWNMTIRRFNIKDETANDILSWTVNSLIKGMGQFKFEKPIEHFLFKTKKSGIDGFVPYQEVKDKIQRGG